MSPDNKEKNHSQCLSMVFLISKSDMDLIYLPVFVEFVVTSGLVVVDDVEE